jgi:hydrogenase expression/formation protein HypD
VRFLDEYRDAAGVQRLLGAIAHIASRPWTIMEICGGQTHAILKYGLDQLLPGSLTLVHGPGCPVCVTPVEQIDKAIEIAGVPGAILTSFGDMLRVPGNRIDLQTARARGGDVRMVYSPLDAVTLARENPTREVVFFAVGFETTAPTTALAVLQARQAGLRNFTLLAAHVRVPPAVRAILEAPGSRIQGFLAPGHVCTVMGFREYEELAKRHNVPIVVTGFEPIDILQGTLECLRLLEAGRPVVENAYARSVRRDGNLRAQALITEVFEPVDRAWRGIGTIPGSGLALRATLCDFDAEERFGRVVAGSESETECIAGLVLQGLKQPLECPAFATRCTPERPLGAPMVSSEGACAAYFRYRRPPS